MAFPLLAVLVVAIIVEFLVILAIFIHLLRMERQRRKMNRKSRENPASTTIALPTGVTTSTISKTETMRPQKERNPVMNPIHPTGLNGSTAPLPANIEQTHETIASRLTKASIVTMASRFWSGDIQLENTPLALKGAGF